MYNGAPLELDERNDRPSLEQLRTMRTRIRQSRTQIVAGDVAMQEGQAANMNQEDFGYKYIGNKFRDDDDTAVTSQYPPSDGAYERYDADDMMDPDALPTPTTPRLSSEELAPSTFNKFQSTLRQQAIVTMLKNLRQLAIDNRLRAQREKEELVARHEESVRRHKNSLRLQMSRGQELEGVQKLSLDFEDAARMNCDEDQQMARSIMSLMSLSPPRY